MSELHYKKKYLKYKQKYINLELSKNQEGGYAYLAGTYIFFIPKITSTSVNQFIKKNKKITSLDKFTTSIGDYARFLRVGNFSLDHNYNTIYTNNSSFGVFTRKSSNAANTVKKGIESTATAVTEGIESAANTLTEGIESTATAVKEGIESINKGIESINKDIKESIASTAENVAKNLRQDGGEKKEFDPRPIELTEKNLKTIKVFSNDINKDFLKPYVELINEHQGDDENFKITRVMVIEKTSNILWGSTNILLDESF